MPKNPTSPEFRSVSGGYQTPLDSVNGLAGQFAALDPGNVRMSVLTGRVVDSWPKQNSCLVQTAADTFIKCMYPSSGYSLVTGRGDSFSPVIGDMVLFARSHDSDFGFILCSAIFASTSPDGTRVNIPIYGSYADSFDQMMDANAFQAKGIATDGSNLSLPSDMVSGERADFSEYHVGVLAGKLYHKIQAGNLASITFNKIDDFVDLIAHNFHMFNSGFNIQSVCDYGRTNTEILTSPLLGPLVADQYANHTIRIISGWLAAGAATQANGAPNSGMALLDVWNDELGTFSAKSQVGGWIAKANGIYVPIKKYDADDPTGLGDINITGVQAREGFILNPTQGSAAFGCQVRDYVGYQTSGNYRFVRHSQYPNDWSEVDVAQNNVPPLNPGSQLCGFNEVITLSGSQTSGSDTTTQDTNEYRPGDAFCGALPDGSVLLRDAWGSSIEMRGGKIIITNSKDTEIISGRSTIIMSGDDTIIRAQNSAEITCTNDSVRIRGGKNVLIDSKSGAIQLTAEKNTAVSLGSSGDAYQPSGIILRTGSGVVLSGENVGVVCNNTFSVMGETDSVSPFILMKSSTKVDWSVNGGYHYNGDGTGSASDSMVYIGNGDVIAGGDVHLGGEMYAKDGIFTEGDIYGLKNFGVNGYIASTTNGPQVLSFKKPIKAPDGEAKFEQDFENESEHAIDQKYLDGARWPLSADSYDDIEFKYRTVEEYGTSDFTWFENFWQRQYLTGLSSWTNIQSDVDADGEMVYPGKEHLSGGASFVTYKESNVYPDGTPKKRVEQSRSGGEFGAVPLSAMPFHP